MFGLTVGDLCRLMLLAPSYWEKGLLGVGMLTDAGESKPVRGTIHTKLLFQPDATQQP